jgi:hypothetical protein
MPKPNMTPNPQTYEGVHGQTRLPAKEINLKNQAVHILTGAFMVGLLYLGLEHTAWMLFLGCIVYQVIEDWRLHDFSYRDIRGYLMGIAIPSVAWAAWEVYRLVMA